MNYLKFKTTIQEIILKNHDNNKHWKHLKTFHMYFKME